MSRYYQGASMGNRMLGGLGDFIAPVLDTVLPGAGMLYQTLRSILSGTGCRFYADNCAINMQVGSTGTTALYTVLHTALQTEVLPSMKLKLAANGQIFNVNVENPDAIPVEYTWMLYVLRYKQDLPTMWITQPPSAQERHAREQNVRMPARSEYRRLAAPLPRYDVNVPPQPLTTNRVWELKLPTLTDSETNVLDADTGLLLGYEDAYDDYDEADMDHPNGEINRGAQVLHQWAVDSGAYPGPVKLNPGDSIILMAAATDNPERPESMRTDGDETKLQLTGVFSWDVYKNTIDPSQFTEQQPTSGNSASSGRFL